jgi:hypothetical protein
MIRIQGRAVVYGELWFAEEPPVEAGVDVLVYRYRPAPVPKARAAPLHSLQTGLAGPPEEIAAGFEQSCRRQIRCAERQDGLQYELFPDAVAALDEFAAFYDAFARQKGLWPADRHWLSRAAAARQLLLSCVSRDGERLVWHAHLRAGTTVQLACSASWFRTVSGEQRAAVGRANRWLHWRDMLAFREAGMRHYDWGGMFADESTPERAGLNRFKRTFGGTPVLAYECSAPATLRGRVWLTVRSALRRREVPRPLPAARAA